MNERYPMRSYYRDVEEAQPPATSSSPQAPSPVFDSEAARKTWNEANVASAGPYRAVFGKPAREVEIPCAVSPLGVNNRAVLLAQNSSDKTVFVRVVLGRNSAEGRIGLAPQQEIVGVAPSPMVWANLTVQQDRSYLAELGPGNGLFAIGTWPGVVPLSVFVTVLIWSP